MNFQLNIASLTILGFSALLIFNTQYVVAEEQTTLISTIPDNDNFELILLPTTFERQGKSSSSTTGGALHYDESRYFSSAFKVTHLGENFICIEGTAFNEKDQISINALGHRDSTITDIVYSMKGSLNVNGEHDKKSIAFSITEGPYTAPDNDDAVESVPDVESESSPVTDKITLVSYHYSRIYLSDIYKITTRVYDAHKNPRDDFNQNDGYLPNTNVTAVILSNDGKILHTFQEVTDELGYFIAGFNRFPGNFALGTYTVKITAQKDGAQTTNQHYLHILGRDAYEHVRNSNTSSCLLQITTSSLLSGTINLAYSQTLSATGCVAPYVWSIVSGNLPTGLSLNSSTGEISGISLLAQTASFTVKVTDSEGNSTTKDLSITINLV